MEEPFGLFQYTIPAFTLRNWESSIRRACNLVCIRNGCCKNTNLQCYCYMNLLGNEKVHLVVS
jgi:hypothetical protein